MHKNHLFMNSTIGTNKFLLGLNSGQNKKKKEFVPFRLTLWGRVESSSGRIWWNSKILPFVYP